MDIFYFCGSLLTHKKSKELHDNKEKTTGTSLFSKQLDMCTCPPIITKTCWCLEGYLVSSFLFWIVLYYFQLISHTALSI